MSIIDGRQDPSGRSLPAPDERCVGGICRDDAARLDRALAGMSYPADKWQLIAHAEQPPAGRGRNDRRAILLLWALPASRYSDLAHVLAGAARTSRGHPRRDIGLRTLHPRPELGRSPPGSGHLPAGGDDPGSGRRR